MTKVTFIIDGSEYKAVFTSDDEIIQFIYDNLNDGSDIRTVSKERYSLVQLWADDDFEEDYKIELTGLILIPNIKFKKLTEIEATLKDMGVL